MKYLVKFSDMRGLEEAVKQLPAEMQVVGKCLRRRRVEIVGSNDPVLFHIVTTWAEKHHAIACRVEGSEDEQPINKSVKTAEEREVDSYFT